MLLALQGPNSRSWIALHQVQLQLYIKFNSSNTVTQVGQQPKTVLQVRLTVVVKKPSIGRTTVLAESYKYFASSCCSGTSDCSLECET